MLFVQTFLASALISHIAFGQLCMVPMTFAQVTPMPHEEHMAMAMTPVAPMSADRCDHCMEVQSNDGDQSQQQAGCAGHCLALANTTRAMAITFRLPVVVTATLLPVRVFDVPATASFIAPPAMAPPIALHIDTTILRL
jgi:hypothetical protein